MENRLAILAENGVKNSSSCVADQIQYYFGSTLRKENFPKGVVINAPGHITDKVYLIHSGLIISTSLSDGKELGCNFYSEGDIGGDLSSFLTNKPSKVTIRIIEPSVLTIVNRSDLDSLHEECQSQKETLHHLLYNQLINTQQLRIEELLQGSAIERYKMLQLRFPSVVHRLPLGFIASFLGMQQETLSRIRSKK